MPPLNGGTGELRLIETPHEWPHGTMGQAKTCAWVGENSRLSVLVVADLFLFRFRPGQAE